jgi:hypothetical protein
MRSCRVLDRRRRALEVSILAYMPLGNDERGEW